MIILGDDMKKGVLVIIVGMLFCLTGCSEKKLVCTSTGKDLGKEVKTKVVVKFDNKEASKVEETIDMTFEEEYRSSIDSIYKALEEQYKLYDGKSGIKVVSTKGDDNINVKINIDVKAQKDAENAVNVIDTAGTRSDIKKSLETEGYTCK